MEIGQSTVENMGLMPGFWCNKSVFVTGHTGFKGSWLSLWLQRLEAKVHGYALEPPTTPSLFETARVKEGMQSVLGDIRHLSDLQQAMQKARPEIAFHLAAQPLVRASYSTPAETFATNVMGTVHFLEAVRHTPSVRVAIVVTSDKCYDNPETQRGFRETDPMGGKDPYSGSKGCAELATASYRSSFFNNDRVAIATVRAGNVIGGGDWAADRLIPDLVRAFTQNRPLALRFPQAVRPWQHVLEPLRGYLKLAERLWHKPDGLDRGWNFGPRCEDARPVVDVVRTAARIWGDGARWTADSAASPAESRYLYLDCSGARDHLHWTPSISLDRALAWTLDWYRCHAEGTIDMRAFTEDQITSYEALAVSGPGCDTYGMGACCA